MKACVKIHNRHLSKLGIHFYCKSKSITIAFEFYSQTLGEGKGFNLLFPPLSTKPMKNMLPEEIEIYILAFFSNNFYVVEWTKETMMKCENPSSQMNFIWNSPMTMKGASRPLVIFVCHKSSIKSLWKWHWYDLQDQNELMLRVK